MSPDEQFEEKRKEEEKTRLQNMIEKLTDDDKDKIFQKGAVGFIQIYFAIL